MTIPSRPAPAPPTAASRQVSRYTPTTNWDDKPFPANYNQQMPARCLKKPPPPRPPPPKLQPAAPLKKPGAQQSVNILSNLFGRHKAPKSTPAAPSTAKLPPAMPLYLTNPNYTAFTAPPSSTKSSLGSASPSAADLKLISFDSPPGSPTFTHKTASDCVSVDSFGSDSNCSPNNGFSSQAESGFEDDFALSSAKPSPILADPFDIVETMALKPPIAQKPLHLGQTTSFYASTVPVIDESFLDNGKSLIKPEPPRVMPTIIRPAGKKYQAPPRPKDPNPYSVFENFDDEEEEDEDSLEEPPMPTIPPPPPPPEFLEENPGAAAASTPAAAPAASSRDEDEETESYAIALYDFEGEQDGDLPFRINEKIYLLQQMNETWFYGRNKRGCEGIFPTNFVEVRIPLKKTAPEVPKVIVVTALFDFEAETSEDLTLRANDKVTILYRINDEWLYGKIGTRRGQFPANFVDHVPADLPLEP